MMILSRFWVLIYLCAFICNGFLNPVEAYKCKIGERKSRGNMGRCEPCPDEAFQAVPNESQKCQPCNSCNESSGSEVISKCTKTSNAICQCRGGFTNSVKDSTICKCPVGSGLGKSDTISNCRECEHGFFTTDKDSTCAKWRECSSGVKTSGTTMADVICNEESESDGKTLPSMQPTSPSGSIQTVSKPLIQNQSQGSSRHPDVPTVTPAVTGPKSTTLDYGQVMPLIGIVLLLTFLLTAVTCKLVILPCIKNYKNPGVKAAQDSICRRPVEESGDNSLSSLVKTPSLGEP
ncbi:tumor necrosis factor receptor superfamily member 4 isoform X1 [Salvelinus sp. IW2-2015]|uniref:tumor necrosis factor receptor superfamily member 4 isoform X1 n=1 Tax=Salvelinus sp. IW2-2015 TaxID=2691554 RepID=UPI000CDFDF6E|nr:tumor necrosis factor receptor superfamily member 4 isoform X1 [Salvelinus alpinus]